MVRMAMQIPSPPSSPTQALWGPRQVAASLLGLAGIWALGGVALALLEWGLPDANGRLAAAITLEGGILALAWWFGPRAKGLSLSALGFRSVSLGATARYGLMVLLGNLTIGVLYVLLAEQIGSDTFVPPPVPAELGVQGAVVPGFLLVAVLAPLAEEAFFRGFVFAGLVWRLGLWPAAFVSAALFAAAHGTLGLLVPAFASGLLFVWAFRRSGSLWPPVAAHAVQNALAFSAAV